MTRRRRQLRRIRAVLAGGLVFGIGSAATVAAWTDTESATGSFTAGRFAIELSIDRNWTSSREMTFDAAGMFPGKVVYAPVLIRTSADTTMDGEISVAGGAAQGEAGGIVDSLTYQAVTRSYPSTPADLSSACGESTFTADATYVFGTATSRQALKPEAGSSTRQSVVAAAGSVQVYCFKVTLPETTPNGAQGTGATKTWTFSAKSVAP